MGKTEAVFQTAVIKYLNSLGGVCAFRYSAGAGSHVTGFADIICICREDLVQERGWAACFVELKYILGNMQANQEAVAAFLKPYGKTYCPKTTIDIEDLGEKLTGIRKPFKFNY